MISCSKMENIGNVKDNSVILKNNFRIQHLNEALK